MPGLLASPASLKPPPPRLSTNDTDGLVGLPAVDPDVFAGVVWRELLRFQSNSKNAFGSASDMIAKTPVALIHGSQPNVVCQSNKTVNQWLPR